MALGKGNWSSQNKLIPGTYINFTSPTLSQNSLNERGVVALVLDSDWGEIGKVLRITKQDFILNSQKYFGYNYADEQMLRIREVFKNAREILVYRLGNTQEKADNSFATARYGGARGNDIKINIKTDGDEFIVETFLDNLLVDSQTVASSEDLIDNDFVVFSKTATLAQTLALSLSGGSDVTAVESDYQKALKAIESYDFNILCCENDDSDIVDLFVDFTKNLCENEGANFQLVCYKKENADSEYIVSVENESLDGDEFSLVYWVSGVLAKAGANESVTGKIYDGELEIDLDYSQSELREAIENGKFMLHSVNGTPMVLRDINSFVSTSQSKGKDFCSNQIIRLITSLAKDIGSHFGNFYLGKIPNDESGRVALWNDICKILESYKSQRAIDTFNPEKVVIETGDDRKTVLCTVEDLVVSGAMESLYMNVVII